MRLNPTKREWLAKAIEEHATTYGHLPPLEQPCLVWPWGKTLYGYGKVYIAATSSTTTHRYVYELVNGPIPGNLQALHHCDNPPCFNPAHIYAGTHQENMRDCMARGRHRAIHGEKHHARKLTDEQVRQILAFKDAGIAAATIGMFYRVSENVIFTIWRDIGWKHVKR